jgi:hypothetical protein
MPVGTTLAGITYAYIDFRCTICKAHHNTASLGACACGKRTVIINHLLDRLAAFSQVSMIYASRAMTKCQSPQRSFEPTSDAHTCVRPGIAIDVLVPFTPAPPPGHNKQLAGKVRVRIDANVHIVMGTVATPAASKALDQRWAEAFVIYAPLPASIRKRCQPAAALAFAAHRQTGQVDTTKEKFVRTAWSNLPDRLIISSGWADQILRIRRA